MKRLLIICCAFFLCAILGLHTAQAAPITIKIADAQGDTEPSVVALRTVFKNYVEEKSNGEMTVEVYTNSSLGNTNTVFQGLQFGTIQMVFDSTANLTPYAPALALFDLPYLFPDVPSIDRTLASDASMALTEELKKKKVTPLYMLSGGDFRYLLTTTLVTKLEDVQGLKVRTTPSKSHMAAIGSLGMAPTPMPGSEMLTGMQQGVVKGMDSDPCSVYSHGFYEVGPFFFASEHIPVTYIFLASTRFLDKLSPENRQIVLDGAKLWYDATRKGYAEYNAMAMKDMQETKGVKLTVPSKEEKERWIEKSKSAWDALPADLKAKAEELRKIAWGN